MSIRTMKIPYKVNDPSAYSRIKEYILNYNSVLRFTYNRLMDSNFMISTKQLTELQKQMNHVFIDSHFLNSAQHDARQLKDKGRIIFGGRLNMIQRCRGQICKEEFKENRVVPLYSIGMAAEHGNRKFNIISTTQVLFKPSKKEHFILGLPKLHSNYLRDFERLLQIQDSNAAPITYKLDLKFIYIVFEDSILYADKITRMVSDRVFSIDLNPNYIGWSVVDWSSSENYRLIDSGVVPNKLITDAQNRLHEASNSMKNIHLNNKKTFENNDTSQYLATLAKHYKCMALCMEKLEILSTNRKQGKEYNRLVNNQWNRSVFYLRLKKYCDRFQIKFYEVVADYSSFEGNLLYRKTGLPDMCLASIELGRRAYEFHHQYVLQDKPKQKNIMFDTSEKAVLRIKQSLEELHYAGAFVDVKSLYKEIKTRNLKYRVQLEESILTAVSSKKSIKSKIILYSTSLI